MDCSHQVPSLNVPWEQVRHTPTDLLVPDMIPHTLSTGHQGRAPLGAKGGPEDRVYDIMKQYISHHSLLPPGACKEVVPLRVLGNMWDLRTNSSIVTGNQRPWFLYG